MPATQIDHLLQVWAASQSDDGGSPPFADHRDLYETIDATTLEAVPWQSFSVSYNGDRRTDGPCPPWMNAEFDVWFRDPRALLENQLGNPDFVHEIDFAPKCVVDSNGKCRYQDFMSGNWAWRQADLIAQDPATHDSAFCPAILGSDKITVSIATGQNEYYPVYISNGMIHNNVRRAHRHGVSLLALSIPKTDCQHHDSPEFRRFRRQLFHASLNYILQSLRPGMTTPEIIRYGDGHYRRTIFGLGPYIGDYPEQVLLACVVQGWCAKCTGHQGDLDGEASRRSHAHTLACFEAMSSKELWDNYGIIDGIMPFTHGFPRADIHELLSPDVLHQVIKGTFKDHLVTWVEEYIVSANNKKDTVGILADIDRRIAAAPSFPGLRRFPEGRGFKQWTGDDSKALMKVYLPAISGHVPPQMVRAIAAFMEFCYLVRRSVLDEASLVDLNSIIASYHREREIFRDVGIRPDGFSLPRQHSLVHYRRLIQDFGAPNGLCSSITESKHIKAVKEPWRRSSHFNALPQMLLINERLDKLNAARVNFQAHGMLDGSLFEGQVEDVNHGAEEDDDGGAVDTFNGNILGEVKLARCHVRKRSRNLGILARDLRLPQLPTLVRRFLFEQTVPNNSDSDLDISANEYPRYHGKIYTYTSAVATFYAPSDLSGIGGMYRERIRSTRSWRNSSPRYDCVYAEADADLPGFRGLHVARVLPFFSIRHHDVYYPCALVTWFSPVDDEPCEETGMWVVEPDLDDKGERVMSVVHLDTILRGAHLIGMAGSSLLPQELKHTESLNAFHCYYVNKYIDHHAHEIAF
ncbi:hypothetical protein F5146DRAFT_981835 [Armillaria mellea]|nr:hypothetical protein F5146DRAFT_981835 [Armillaria mellea]